MGPNAELGIAFAALVLAGALGGVISLLLRDRRP